MNLSDAIAVLAFVVTILSIAFAFGKQHQRLGNIETGLNGLGTKVDNGFAKYDKMMFTLDRRLDKTNEFRVRADQRVADLQRQVYGDAVTEMMRSGNPFNPNGSNDDTIPL